MNWSDRLFAGLGRRVLDRIDRGLARGVIVVTLPDGTKRRLGARDPGPEAVVDLRRWRALFRLATGGSSGWYEAWAAGDWSSPDPVALFELFTTNRHSLGRTGRADGPGRWLRRSWHRARRNNRTGARRNIHDHYDLGNDFYRCWLDPTLTYSSALFAEPVSADEPLEAAQTRKLRAMLARSGVQPGGELLEIGSGWGSFAEVAARAGIGVHGITLSDEQRVHAETRLAAAGLHHARFTLTDYRDVSGQYDGVASIEMIEAVGQEYWPDYVAAIARALKPGARAALQFIAIDEAIFPAYAANVDFIQRWIFPGGMLISERRLRALAEAAGLEWRDREAFAPHYAETLRRWRAQFDAALSAGGLPARFDTRFLDRWRYYLMYCEGGFRGGGIDVVQVTLTKPA